MPGTESKITPAGLEALRALWAAEEPLSLGQVKAALEGRACWRLPCARGNPN